MTQEQKTGYFMIFIGGCLWGTVGLFVSLLKGCGADSSTIAFIRIGVGALLFVPLMLSQGGIKLFKIDKKGLIICFVLGVFSQALFNFSYSESINNVGVATASVLLYTAPIFVCVMSKIFFSEVIGRIKVIALSINIIGCILTVTNGDFTTIQFSVYGVIAGVLAGFLYGLMTIVSKTTTGKYESLTILFYSFVFGAVALAIIGRPWVIIADVVSMKFAIISIGYGLIPSVGAYYFYMNGLSKHLETSKVPVIASVETVVAAIIGISVFSESMGIFKLLGIACVLISIAIMNMSKQVENNKDNEYDQTSLE